MLQSSIARLEGSLMALNKTSSWEVLHAFRLMEISRLMEVTCIVEVLYFRFKNIYTTSCGNATQGKEYFQEGIHQVTHKIRRGATCGHADKNEIVIEWYYT